MKCTKSELMTLVSSIHKSAVLWGKELLIVYLPNHLAPLDRELRARQFPFTAQGLRYVIPFTNDPI